MTGTVLAIERLTTGYEEAAVIRDLDLTVAAGEIVALLGANGAGKTTTLRAISGVLHPMTGRIVSPARTSPACRSAAGRGWASRTCLRTAGSSSGSRWRSTFA
jgi:ABC-type branched-subunit amino acid transport system ATPase component